MEIDKIKQIVDDFLVSEFEADQDIIVNDANMKESLGLDSLDYIDMVVLIESNFGVKVGEADFKKTTTFQSFYEMIQEKINNQVSA